MPNQFMANTKRAKKHPNWGGRRPGAESVTGPAGRGTLVRVDSVRHIANEGSVSVIDLERRTLIRREANLVIS